MTSSNRFTLWLMLALLAVFCLPGCGGGGGDNPPAAISPNGYYESGTATVKDTDNTTDINITDLQGMLNGTRLMLMSATEQLLYDGTITITGNDYTGELKVYKSGLLVTVDLGSGPVPMLIPVSGRVVGGSSIEGTLTAEQAGKGSFALTYAQTNNQKADLTRVDSDFNYQLGDLFWGARMYVTTGRIGGFAIWPDGTVAPVTVANSGLLNNCDYFNSNFGASVFTPVAGSSLYEAAIGVGGCATAAIEGQYTGLATSLSRNATDDILLLAFTDGRFGFFAEYAIFEFD